MMSFENDSFCQIAATIREPCDDEWTLLDYQEGMQPPQ